jgi:hypothetical protein
MLSFLRAGGHAAALLVVGILFSAPSHAAEAQAISVTTAVAPSSTIPVMPALPAAPTEIPSSSGAIPAPAATPVADVAPALPIQPLSLEQRVGAFVNYGNQDAEQLCLAKAVYFEARSESLEGQLAVAEVVLNRAASGIYPPSICGVVTQRAQFSFIRAGRFPRVDTGSDCWHKALAIADVAQKKLIRQIAPNVLWYHASYVAPTWRRNLTRFVRIGMHIFYS